MFILSETQITALRAAFNNPNAAHPSADFYRLLANFGEQDGTVDPASIIWLRGAAEVNENSGSQSAFIRNYNKDQYETRYGGALSDATMDAVSDLIAENVFQQIVGTAAVPGLLTIPDVGVLADLDAEPAADSLFEGDAGGWAGNPLFLFLGYSTAFYENIVETSGDTYDAIAMLKFTAENISGNNFLDLGRQIVNYPPGLGTAISVVPALDRLLVDAYGANSLSVAADIGFLSSSILGRVNEGDTLSGTGSRDFIHGGGGDDTILGSSGADLIDGGSGYDIADYSSSSGGSRYIFRDDVESTADFVASSRSTGLFGSVPASFFGIEEIRAGSADDEVQLQGLEAAFRRIDGGSEGELGDQISAFYARSALDFDMSTEQLTLGDVTITATDFERVEGSDFADTVKADDGLRKFDGRHGKDEVDFSGVSSGRTIVTEGTGADGEVVVQNVEKITGTAQADTIRAGAGDQELIGGGGADTLEGGAGADTYQAGNGDTIKDKDGSVFLDGTRLTGGKLQKDEDASCEPGNDNESDENKVWKDESTGATYTLDETTLTVTLGGSSITINDFTNGDLGITLDDESTGDGDDCDDSPDDFSSPLVLDLDGDGVELTALATSGVFFDIDNDGIAERTGWVAPDDGLLVFDRDGDGRITSGNELFGYGTTYSGGFSGSVFGAGRGISDLIDPTGLDIAYESGFARLAEFDQNADGVVDSNDFRFEALKVWRDLNGDGQSQDTELFGLTDAGVASIKLDATRVREQNAGNLITDRSTYTSTTGETRAVVDAWFLFNQYDNRAIDPVDISDEIAALPDLKGAGRVLSLREEMALNPELQAKVSAFAAASPSDLSQVTADVAAIMFAWTGVSATSAFSRGAYADGRAVQVMEAFTDTGFAQWSGADPRPYAGGVLSDQFDAALQFATARLILQTDWGQALFPELKFLSGINTVLDAGTQASTMIDRLTATLPDDPAAALAHLQAGFRVLDLVRLSFDTSDGVSFAQAAAGAIAQAGLDLTYQQVLTARVGGDGDDSFLLQSARGNQFDFNDIRVVSGGAGDDFIKLGGSQAIVYWGEGQGNDSITLDPVQGLGWQFTPQVEVRLVGLVQADIEIVQSDQSLLDGIIRVIATGEELTLRNLVNGRGDPSGQLVFADGTTLAFGGVYNDVVGQAATGTDGDDTLFQGGTASTLDGGAGDDLLQGSSAATDYVFDVGYGDDVIVDGGTGNRVLFGPGITAANVQARLTGLNFDTLVIEVTDGLGAVIDSLTIQNQQRGENPVVTDFILSDGTSLSEADLLGDFGADTTGNDIVLGTNDPDFLPMNAGDDTVYGRDGGDFYEWSVGDGNDRIIDRGTGEDIVVLNAAFAEFDATVLGNGGFAFTHRTSGETLTVERGIESFGFDDLFGIDPTSLAELITLGGGAGGDLTPLIGTTDADTLEGTNGGDEIAALAGDDTITALDGDDIILAGLGNDTVDAGAGNDTVSGSDGEDVITGGAGDDDIAAGTGMDTVFGGLGDDRIDVGDRGDTSSANRRANEAYGGEGDDTIIGGWEDDTLFGGSGNDTINGDFGDDTLSGGQGDDLLYDRGDSTTYLYDLGDGHDLILDDNSRFDLDVLQFGAGIAASDITWSFALVEGRPDLGFFGFDDAEWGLRGDIAGGGSVTMRGGFNDRIGGLNEVAFANGDRLSIDSITAAVRAPNSGDQLIVGLSRGSDDILAGGAGNDTIVGNFGDQTFLFGTGDGDDILLDPYADVDSLGSSRFMTSTIQLGGGLSAADITITRGGDGDRDVILTLPSGETLTIRSQYDTQQDRFAGSGDGLNDHDWIDRITFLDGGPAIDAAAIRAAALAATAGDDLQIGTSQNDVFVASAGSDIMRGGLGSDTYTFGIGDGADRIEETAANVKYAPDEFEFEGGSFDLSTLRETDTLTFGAGISVSDLTLTATGETLSDIRVTLNANTEDSLLLTDQLSPDANWGRATNLGGFEGPPRGEFLARTTVEVTRDLVSDIELGPDGEVSQALWNAQWAAFFGSDPLFQAGIERFVFADGTILNRDEFAALVTVRDDAGDNTISTGALGGTLEGGAGFDTLLGGTGDDTYLFGEGMDQDRARDAGGTDAVAFGAGIEILEIAFTRTGENGEDLLIELGGTTRNAMLIEGQFAGDGRGIEVFRFADGTEISAETIKQTLLARAQTPDNDVILGYEDDDVILGLAGDDLITPLGGSDVVDGGAGRDTVQLRGVREDYDIAQQGDWVIVSDLTGRDGEVRMRNVEILQFASDPDSGTAVSETLIANIGPVAEDLAFAGREDVNLQLSVEALLAGATDPDSATLMLATVGNAANGAVAIDAQGRVIFTPDADFNGAAGFDYTVVDGDGATATARASVSIAAVNDPVTAVADTIIAVEDMPFTINAAGLVGNDLDADGDALTITQVTAIDVGVALDGAGNVVVTPDANQFGAATFTYTVSDGEFTSEGQVTVNIAAVNDAPTIGGLTLSTREDTALRVGSAILTAAASDVDGDVVSVVSVGNATGGTVAFADDVVTFTPDADFTGEAGFDVTVSDGRGGSVTGRAAVAITPVPDDPVLAAALADIDVPEDNAIAFAIPAGSFTDPDGTQPTLTATRADGSALPGWLTFNGTTFSGQPPAHFNGAIAIMVVASDETGGTVSDEFTLTITPVNDAPVAVGTLADITIAEGDAVAVQFNVGDIFADVDGDPLTLDLTLADGSALPAWLSFDGANLTGTAPDGADGQIDLRVTASDGALSADIGFGLTVTPVNDAPIAVADTGPDVDAGATVQISGAALLANDSDPDGDPLVITGVTQTGAGTVALGADGNISFTAATGFAGVDTFSYTVSDGTLSASTTVSLTVTDDTSTDPYEGWYIGSERGDFISSAWVGNTKIFGAGGRDFIFGSRAADMLDGGAGNDYVFGNSGNDSIFGNDGRDYLSGGFGADVIDGGAGNDKLRGDWGNDTFVFSEGTGRDRILDFRNGDKIAIDHAGFDTFADVQAVMSGNWFRTTIDLGAGDSITLDWVRAHHLDADDFLFL